MNLRLFSYRLPFRNTFVSSAGNFTHREGLIACYTHDEHTIAYGEIAPLPGFSGEQLSEVREVLTTHLKLFESAIAGDDPEYLKDCLAPFSHLPSLVFGMQTLFYDLTAKTQKLPLGGLLSDRKRYTVGVNGVIGSTSPEEALLKARELSDKGIETFKLKVGIDFRNELSVIERVRAGFPKAKIRIDANGAWSVAEAISNLRSLANLEIEYCEQPVRHGDPEALAHIRNQTDILIAADESFRNKKDAERLIDFKAADVLVLKPMLFGSYEDIAVTIELAKSHNIEVVFTTSLESVIGRTATAFMAAHWGSQAHAHGLSTGSLLEEDLGTDPIDSGVYHIGTKPGLGIDVATKYLREITV